MKRKSRKLPWIGAGLLIAGLATPIFYIGSTSAPFPDEEPARGGGRSATTEAGTTDIVYIVEDDILPQTGSAPTVAEGREHPGFADGAPPVVVAPPLVPEDAQGAMAAPVSPDVEPRRAGLAGNTAATRRMYGAHAPLREIEVADPDSESNRRILQTMVGKALLRARTE